MNDDFPLVDESIESVGQSAQNYLKQHPAYLLMSISLIAVLYFFLFYFQVEVVQLYIVPVFLPIVAYLYLMRRLQHEFMRQFAIANGFSYAAKGSLDGLAGTLFQIGHSKSVTDVVRGQYHGCPLTLFTYTYVTGSGRSSQTHNFTVFQFKLNANMPDILVENKNHFFRESLFDQLPGKVSLSLEGDFNKFFQVSVPEGSEIEALEVLAPDIMAELEDKCKSLSLEIIGDYLFIYKDTVVNSKKDLYSLYQGALYFEEKLAPVLSRIKLSQGLSLG